ncbi:TetR/AcrR family transcriptional regulator [Gluconacetobacter azotocaptans]|uniref:TetR/AcrR family transcriptional regulator n=1 Tax=Gluconacetobacter azotocaptans TaxID=142834 RepID=UPI00195D1141|nr:TetR/AcrR family transcriptional regulator [Gluconacetobacter azotocaptans]MBM9403756.1 TetR/AcrR family transcriptional regulator [Gluconacetobacter azotocaptans]
MTTARGVQRRRAEADDAERAIAPPHRQAAAEVDLSAAERRREILEVAAQLFAERGFKATSIRDIAEHVGMLAGSLYYHIKSKEALFVEIHDKALDAAATRVQAAMQACDQPWDRLQAACAEMLEIQLNPESLTLPIMNNFRSVPDDMRAPLVRKRDEFEMIFRKLVDELPLSANIDRTIYRILLLRLLNTADDWYRDGRLSRRQIAEQIVTIFRHGVDMPVRLTTACHGKEAPMVDNQSTG